MLKNTKKVFFTLAKSFSPRQKTPFFDFSRTSFVSTKTMPGIRFFAGLRRGHTLRPSISDWLMFKILERDW